MPFLPPRQWVIHLDHLLRCVPPPWTPLIACIWSPFLRLFFQSLRALQPPPQDSVSASPASSLLRLFPVLTCALPPARPSCILHVFIFPFPWASSKLLEPRMSSFCSRPWNMSSPQHTFFLMHHLHVSSGALTAAHRLEPLERRQYTELIGDDMGFIKWHQILHPITSPGAQGPSGALSTNHALQLSQHLSPLVTGWGK